MPNTRNAPECLTGVQKQARPSDWPGLVLAGAVIVAFQISFDLAADAATKREARVPSLSDVHCVPACPNDGTRALAPVGRRLSQAPSLACTCTCPMPPQPTPGPR